MSRKSELMEKITGTPGYSDLLEKMSEEERRTSMSFIEGLVDAFVPALETFERIAADPELCRQFQEALAAQAAEEKKDAPGDKGST